MKYDLKNHIKAFFWVAIFFLIGFFIYTKIDIGLPDKPLFFAYLGFIFALLLFFVVDYFRKPNFIICLGAINERPDGQWRFLHVNVINLDWPRWFFLFRRDLASNTSAKAIFREKDFGKIIFSMIGRWSTNLEPIVPQFNSQSDKTQLQMFYIYNEEMARKGALSNISVSDSVDDLREGKLVVAFKSKEENECYGFNDNSYNPSKWEHDRHFRTTDQKLERGVYDVEVIVRSGRAVSKKNFILENLGNTLDSFQLKYSTRC